MLFGPCKRASFHESPDRISLTSHVLTLKAHIRKSRMSLCLLKHFEASLTLFASILMLNNKYTLSNVYLTPVKTQLLQ